MAGARVLAVRERQVPAEARTPYFATVRERTARAQAARAHFWVFEHDTDPGRFLEFTEGASADAVRALLDGAPADGLWREFQGE